MEAKLDQLNRQFWQFEIGGVALPHVKAHGKIGRREGEWRLKVWGERLLFCADVEPEQVFAIATPCVGEGDLVAFWRAAIENGDYGRVWRWIQSWGNSDETQMHFVRVFGRDGSCWAREWCGGDWMQMEVPTFDRAIEQPDWSPAMEIRGDTNFIQQMARRPFPDSERTNQPLMWLRGSRAQWIEILSACATLNLIGRVPGYGSAIVIEYGSKYPFFYDACSPFSLSHMSGGENASNWTLPAPLPRLLTRHFVALGWGWSMRGNKKQKERRNWKVTARAQTAQISFPAQPSFHEQLEARLILRDWLRGKISEQASEKLLSEIAIR